MCHKGCLYATSHAVRVTWYGAITRAIGVIPGQGKAAARFAIAHRQRGPRAAYEPMRERADEVRGGRNSSCLRDIVKLLPLVLVPERVRDSHNQSKLDKAKMKEGDGGLKVWKKHIDEGWWLKQLVKRCTCRKYAAASTIPQQLPVTTQLGPKSFMSWCFQRESAATHLPKDSESPCQSWCLARFPS